LLITLLLLCVFYLNNYAQGRDFQIDENKEKNYLAFSIALFDFIQNNSTSLEGRTEFRLYKVPIPVKPLSGIMANTDGGLFLYVGLLYDIRVSSFFYITPSFSPGFYYRSSSKELGFVLNFRSQLEISLIFENDFRFGISFNHISNGTLGNINPGVESLALSLQLPL
jgi:hypothetical protein